MKPNPLQSTDPAEKTNRKVFIYDRAFSLTE